MYPATEMQRRGYAFIVSALLGLPITGAMQANAAEKVLHTFQGGTDGAVPWGTPVADSAGNLYGTTAGGGAGTNCFEGNLGCGTVFKLAPDGSENVLYSFQGGSDGARPFDGLAFDGSGNLYGTTAEGGGASACNGGCGTIFKITSAGTESVLYSFQGGSDGEGPQGGLIFDSKGNLFGMTGGGGDFNGICSNVNIGCGTVFELKPDGTIATLYTFQGGADGAVPYAGLSADKNGNLYGTTAAGGNLQQCSGYGCGVVFKVAPDGSESVLYTFQGGADGGVPESTLIADSAGNLYGTTTTGGNVQSCRQPDGCGTVFKVAPDGTETVLYAFKGGVDGDTPYAGVTMDKAGNLYGTTYFGGGSGCRQTGHFGCGTVFKLAPNGKETVLDAFSKRHLGHDPSTGLLLGKRGTLYGTTLNGGRDNNGIVFELKTK